MTPLEFEDYVLCKALDVISGEGVYKRFVYQCAENQEEWALRVQASVGTVGAAVREIQSLVERVRQSDTKLARVCREVPTSMRPPLRVVPGVGVCGLTDTQSKGCVDVSRASKTDCPVLVHSKFHYFFLMLYYTHRLDHVVRCMTKWWLEEQEPDLTMAQLTERFRAQTDLFRSMHSSFEAGAEHVRQSLCHHLSF